jgi:hypothetical protein
VTDTKTSETQPETAHSDFPRRKPRRASNALAPRSLCAATTMDGRPCPVKAVLGLAHCYQHAPELVEERHLARVRGGQEATARRVLPADTPRPVLDSPESIRDYLAETIHRVETGRLAPNVANSVIAAVNATLKLIEVSLSAQLAELEQELAQQRRTITVREAT